MQPSITELKKSTFVNHITITTSLVILILYLKKMSWRPRRSGGTGKTSDNNELKSLETGSSAPVAS